MQRKPIRVGIIGAGWWAANTHALALRALDGVEIVAACRRHGIGVMVWTVDGDRLIDQFLASRMVDVLITNRPVYAASRRAQRAARAG